MFFEHEHCNFDINMDILLSAFHKKCGKEYKIIIYDKYDHAPNIVDKNILTLREWSKVESQITRHVDYIFCSFYQDIIKVLNVLGADSCTKIINIWHGMPIRNIGALDKAEAEDCKELLLSSRRNIVHHIVTSKFYQHIFCKAFNTNIDNVHIFGNIRRPIILSRCKSTSIYIKDLAHNINFTKVVLYCPTHATGNDVNMPNKLFIYDDYNLNSLNKTLKDQSILLLVKKHASDPIQYDSLNMASNIVEIPNDELIKLNVYTQNLFSHTDMLITDASSLCIDYLICNKPILFSNVRPAYKKDRGFISDKLMNYGHTINSQKELIKHILNELQNDTLYQKRNAALPLANAYNDNNTTSRVKELLDKSYK